MESRWSTQETICHPVLLWQLLFLLNDAYCIFLNHNFQLRLRNTTAAYFSTSSSTNVEVREISHTRGTRVWTAISISIMKLGDGDTEV